MHLYMNQKFLVKIVELLSESREWLNVFNISEQNWRVFASNHWMHLKSSVWRSFDAFHMRWKCSSSHVWPLDSIKSLWAPNLAEGLQSKATSVRKRPTIKGVIAVWFEPFYAHMYRPFSSFKAYLSSQSDSRLSGVFANIMLGTERKKF